MEQTEDYLESHYRTLRESDLERSDKFDAQINLSTAVVTGLLAVSAFYIEHFPRLEWLASVALFVICRPSTADSSWPQSGASSGRISITIRSRNGDVARMKTICVAVSGLDHFRSFDGPNRP